MCKLNFSQTAICGGTYIAQSGTIKSPGYPGTNYPDNSNCEWYLEGPTGHYLTITYTAFNLQNSPDCTKDYVEIREYNASGESKSTNNQNPYFAPLQDINESCTVLQAAC